MIHRTNAAAGRSRQLVVYRIVVAAHSPCATIKTD
jgi:hypothetical protein